MYDVLCRVCPHLKATKLPNGFRFNLVSGGQAQHVAGRINFVGFEAVAAVTMKSSAVVFSVMPGCLVWRFIDVRSP
jgi:hypothetical protein